MSLFQYQLWLYAPLILVLVLMAALAVYVFYSTDRRFGLKFVLGPALLMTAYFSFVFATMHMGYAYPSKLPKKFQYLDHAVVLSDDSTKKMWIDIFIISLDPWSKQSRLQRIPWSQKMEDAAKQAQQIRRGGGVATMERKKGEEGKGGQPSDGDEYPEYIPKRVLPGEVTPKSPPSLPGAPQIPTPVPETKPAPNFSI